VPDGPVKRETLAVVLERTDLAADLETDSYGSQPNDLCKQVFAMPQTASWPVHPVMHLHHLGRDDE
jgi:hypothetical protein